jgi:hypothetical protein
VPGPPGVGSQTVGRVWARAPVRCALPNHERRRTPARFERGPRSAPGAEPRGPAPRCSPSRGGAAPRGEAVGAATGRPLRRPTAAETATGAPSLGSPVAMGSPPRERPPASPRTEPTARGPRGSPRPSSADEGGSRWALPETRLGSERSGIGESGGHGTRGCRRARGGPRSPDAPPRGRGARAPGPGNGSRPHTRCTEPAEPRPRSAAPTASPRYRCASG